MNCPKINTFVIDGGYIDYFAILGSNWTKIVDLGVIGNRSYSWRYGNKRLREGVRDVCLLKI